MAIFAKKEKENTEYSYPVFSEFLKEAVGTPVVPINIDGGMSLVNYAYVLNHMKDNTETNYHLMVKGNQYDLTLFKDSEDGRFCVQITDNDIPIVQTEVYFENDMAKETKESLLKTFIEYQREKAEKDENEIEEENDEIDDR